MTATFIDLQNAVVDKARLDEDFDMTRVAAWVNSAYLTAIIETGFYQTSQVTSPALTPDQSSVLVPAGIHKIEFIVPTGSDGQTWGPMRHTQFEDLLRVRAWQGGASVNQGAPSRYSFRSSAAPTIEFWPQAAGGETLTFFGWSLPAEMSAPTDPPAIPAPYEKVIEYGALVHAAEFQKDLLMIQQFQSGYQDWLQRFRGYKNHLASSQPDQFMVEFGRPWTHRNDVDQGY